MVVAAAAVVVVVMEVAVGAVPHIAAADVVVGVGCAAVTRLALVSGRQDRCKALGPSSKPCLRQTWTLTCSKANNNN